MLALTKTSAGPGHLAIMEHPRPAASSGEALIRVAATGVCGTDLHIVDDEYKNKPPVILGHELAGLVEQVGDGLEQDWIGKRVVSETYFSTCSRCIYCRSGRRNLCSDRKSIGSLANGAFAEYIVVPTQGLHAVPDWLNIQAAVLAEPLACVCNCMFDPPVVVPGDRVLVTGPGPVGLLAAQVAKAMGGLVSISGLPSDDARLSVADGLGIGRANKPIEVSTYDVAVECSGSQGGAQESLEAMKPGGRYVQIGVFGKPVTIALDRLFERELVMSSGFASTPKSWARAMVLIETGAIQLPPLLGRIASLEDWESVFSDLRAGRGLKNVLVPPGNIGTND